jgi:hypothetical protein
MYCGAGQQILQWLAQAACLRLAHKRGGVAGQYVPQSVVSKDGQVRMWQCCRRTRTGQCLGVGNRQCNGLVYCIPSN